MKLLLKTIPLVSCLMANVSDAQGVPENLLAMYSMSGECSMFIYSGEKRPCKGTVLNTEYDYGRTGFYFIDDSADGKIISFSGMGQEQVTPRENLILQPLDMIIENENQQHAVGFCTFENPFVGKARVECSAFLENGAMFSGFFLSDGSKPTVMYSKGDD